MHAYIFTMHSNSQFYCTIMLIKSAKNTGRNLSTENNCLFTSGQNNVGREGM